MACLLKRLFSTLSRDFLYELLNQKFFTDSRSLFLAFSEKAKADQCGKASACLAAL